MSIQSLEEGRASLQAETQLSGEMSRGNLPVTKRIGFQENQINLRDI